MLQLVGATGGANIYRKPGKSPDCHGCSRCIMYVNVYGTLSDKCGKPLVESLHGSSEFRHVGPSVINLFYITP